MFYKTKKVVLNASRPRDLKCPNCGVVGSIEIKIFRDVVRQLGSPIPLGVGHEQDSARCVSCHNVFDSANLPPSIRNATYQLSAQTGSPHGVYYWAFVVTLFATFTFASIYFIVPRKESLIDDPRKGDLYETTYYEQHSIVRILDVTSDSLLVEIGKEKYVKVVEDLMTTARENEFGSPLWVSREQLMRMDRASEIANIIRPPE